MAYYIIGVVLVFFKKIVYAGKCYLIYIFVNLFICHTNAMVTDSYRTSCFIDIYFDSEITQFALKLAFISKCLYFLRSIHGI